MCVNNFNPPTVPGQDCDQAKYLCSKDPVTGENISGAGNQNNEASGTCAGVEPESNTTWYYWTAKTSGTLTFAITPSNGTDDWDWVLFELQNGNCNAKTPLRCDYSSCLGPNGSTGMDMTSTDTEEAGGCLPGFSDAYVKYIDMVAGRTYGLLINNFTSANNGFELTFGGTGEFTSPEITVSNDVTICLGESTQITTTTSNVVGAPTYGWSPSLGLSCTDCPNPIATPTTTTTYTVYFADESGCSYTDDITVTVEPCTFDITLTGNEFCEGECGDISVSTSGGTPPFSFTWDNGLGNDSIHNVCPASTTTYNVTVTDNNGVEQTGSTTVTVNPLPVLSTSSTPTDCGQCNGGVTVTVAAPGSYTYAWDNACSTPSCSGLCPASYEVTVTDNSTGCTSIITETVSSSNAPVISATSTPESCAGACDGTATVSVDQPGVTPYSFVWTDGQTGTTATALCAGNQSVTITDATGCTSVATTLVSGPTPLTSSTNFTDNLCFGDAGGTASVSPDGGTTPYLYSWNPGGYTTSTISGLVAGTYDVTVTDDNGCTTTGSVTISDPAELTVTTSSTNTACGSSDGSVTVTPTGGTGPYSYNWTPGSGTDATMTGLGAGTYNVTVTDANGCTATDVANVSGTNSPTVTITGTTDVSCFGDCTGTISTNSTGGTPPYTYLWDNNQTTDVATGLCVGSYSLTVTDAIGCPAVTSGTINGPTELTSTINHTDNLCFGDAGGTGTVTPTGGTTPYQYLWNPGGQTTASISGLTAGTYDVTVTDANGCTTTETMTVVDPSLLQTTTTHTDVSCNATGSVTVAPTGGTSPYIYLWAPGGGTSATMTGITPNTYNVTVTDANGCIETSTTTVVNVDIIPLANFTADPWVVNVMNPEISFVDKSSDAISWYWDFDDGDTSTSQSPTHIYQDTGCYAVTLMVENQYGCRDTIPQAVCVQDIATIYVPNAITPNGDGINDIFTVAQYNFCELEMYIFDRWGNLIAQTSDVNGGWDGTANGGKDIATEDVYVYKIRATDCYGNLVKLIGHVTLIK